MANLNCLKIKARLLSLAMVCAVLGGWAQEDGKVAGVSQPNIILINVDDLGYMDTELYGNTDFHTPNMLRMARMGKTFSNGYAASANCAPSRASLFSGQYNPRHGVYTVGTSERGKSHDRKIIPTPNKGELADSVVTFAERLKDAGYRTIHIGKWHIGDDPQTQGFDVNIGGTHRGHPASYFSPYANPALPDGPDGEYLTDRLTREAVAQLELQQGQRTPFFLYFATFAVHTPLQGKQELVDMLLEKGFDHRTANFGALVENLDTNIGLLLDALERLGLMEETLIVFTSDNGGIASLHSQTPLRAGKGSYYEGGTKVPFVFVWKGKIAPGSHSDVPITNMDLYPTFLAAARTRPVAGGPLDGVDLTPILYGEKGSLRRTLYWHFPIYLEAYDGPKDEARDTLFRTRPGATLIAGEWKFHHYFEDNEYELYNLREDPGERNNLAEKKRRLARKFSKGLYRWQQQLNAPIPMERNPEYKGR